MSQVASHSSAFNSHHGMGHSRQSTSSHRSSHRSSQAPSSSSSTTKLPRTLQRPEFVHISSQAIAAAEPELAKVPIEYIKRGLRDQYSSMMAGISALAAANVPTSILKSHLPSSIPVPVYPTSSSKAAPSYPSHILALQQANSHVADAPCLTFPVHGVVVAAHCAKFPPLPSAHQRPGSSTIKIPVLSLTVPYPAAFGLLHGFMYAHRIDQLLGTLIPMPKQFLQGLTHDIVRNYLASGSKVHQLSSYLVASASNNVQTLMSHANHIRELWFNMVALGMQDPDLWDSLDLAYEVVLGALNLVNSA